MDGHQMNLLLRRRLRINVLEQRESKRSHEVPTQKKNLLALILSD